MPVDEGVIVSFDDFTDQVEDCLMENLGWTEIQVADFISPRTRRLIQAFKEGCSVSDTATLLQSAPPAQQYWD